MRARKGLLGMLMVAAAIAACTEDGPSAAGSGQEAAKGALPGVSLAEEGTISGRVVTTLRTFDGRELLGNVRLVDTASFEGALRRGEVRVDVSSRIERFALTVAQAGAAPTGTPTGALAGRRHEWTARGDAPGSSGFVGTRSATFVREGEAPVSEMTYRRGAEVVARIATTWVRVEGGWLMQARTLTAFHGGRAVSSVETVILEHRVEIGAGALRAPSLATTDGSAVGAAMRGPDDAVANSEGDCQQEFDAMFDALDVFGLATISLAGCMLGPGACLSASIAFVVAARQVDVKESRLNRCLGGEL